MEPQPSKLKPIDLVSYVIYIDHSHEKFIQKCKEKGLLQISYIQKVSELETTPEWLSKGLPVIVNTETRKGYRKSAAETFLNSFIAPVTVKHQVAEQYKRKKLWTSDVETSEEVPPASRIPQYHVRG